LSTPHYILSKRIPNSFYILETTTVDCVDGGNIGPDTMASVSSLDQDMKKLRLSRYTPSAANEARMWIEEILGEKLPNGDLLDSLKDGTILCR
jgi:hypothetical protein